MSRVIFSKLEIGIEIKLTELEKCGIRLSECKTANLDATTRSIFRDAYTSF